MEGMPTRLVREQLLESDRWLDLVHPVERLAYIVLLLKADDLGTLDAGEGQLVRFWREPCNIKSRDDAIKVLAALTDVDLVRCYDVQGKRYAFLPRYRQRFRATTIRRPPPPEMLLLDEPEVLRNINQIKLRSGNMPDNCPPDARQMPGECPALAPVVVCEGADVNTPRARSRPAVRPPFKPPSREEVQAECEQGGYRINQDEFFDHYEANGWMVGKSRMRDWKAAIRNWHRRAVKEAGLSQSGLAI